MDLLPCTVVAGGFAGEKMAFVKSGWLLWESTILKHWKNWFDLWSDGHLIYYGDQTRQSVEDEVHVAVDCINICVGYECRDIQPPDGKPKDCMLQIVCRDGKTISLGAESTDDCLDWKFTLQDYIGLCWLRSHVWWDSCGFLPTSLHSVCCTDPWGREQIFTLQNPTEGNLGSLCYHPFN